MENQDYYEILGVSRDATEKDLKKAFRKKAAELHPDRNKDPKAPEQFKQVNEAYQVLSDPQKRSMYDQYGSAAFAQDGGAGGGRGGFGGQGFEFDFSEMFGGADVESMFGDQSIFSDLFGRRGGRTRTKRGDDIAIAIHATMLDVLNGPEKEISYQRAVHCPQCGGSGGDKVEQCRTCNGSGRVAQVSRSIFGNVQMVRECPTCQGTGKEIVDKCTKCKGDSVVTEQRSFKIRIPQGIENGMNIRFRGEGSAGKFRTEHGDLFVQVNVQPDTRFERSGDDLIIKVPVPVYSLVLGDEIQVSTLDGDTKIRIPAGLNVGEDLILRGLGLPNFRSKKRGNILLKLDINIPKKLKKEERDLYQQLRAIDISNGK